MNTNKCTAHMYEKLERIIQIATLVTALLTTARKPPPTTAAACCELLMVYVPYTSDMSASDINQRASNMGTLETCFARSACTYVSSLL
jgi:hypothetical protein